MKVAVILCLALYNAECRKIVPIDKNANVAFINMEGGGAPRPNAKPAVPIAPVQSKPASPINPATPAKPVVVSPTPVTTSKLNLPQPVQPQTQARPSQIQPKPVNPLPVSNPITTPGPGSVKQLVNFYDSQGKASPIRPYSYSQAVKQG